MVHQMYGNALGFQRTFCYLGVYMSNSGTKSKNHAARKTFKAEKMAVMLGRVEF